MDDIHTPSVASGPTTNGYSNGVPREQLTFNELMTEKARIEGELTALGAVLDSVRALNFVVYIQNLILYSTVSI